jgi:hypothetical protein
VGKIKIAFRKNGVPMAHVWLVTEVTIALNIESNTLYINVVKDGNTLILMDLAELAVDGNEVDLEGWLKKFLSVRYRKIS